MSIDLHTINKDYHSITAHQGGTWEVSLDSATLAALETINAVQSGTWTVELGATTLAALETIELGATTLAALETINAAQSGAWEVSLSSATLAALETVTTVEGGFSSWKVTAESMDSAAETQMVSTPLANRVAVLIENLSSNDLYIKNVTGVSTANGLKIPKGTSHPVKLSAAANIFGIMSSGGSGQDVRVVEYAV